jgi:hypothetical protein
MFFEVHHRPKHLFFGRVSAGLSVLSPQFWPPRRPQACRLSSWLGQGEVSKAVGVTGSPEAHAAGQSRGSEEEEEMVSVGSLQPGFPWRRVSEAHLLTSTNLVSRGL